MWSFDWLNVQSTAEVVSLTLPTCDSGRKFVLRIDALTHRTSRTHHDPTAVDSLVCHSPHTHTHTHVQYFT